MIIFLDFDGVLANNQSAKNRYPSPGRLYDYNQGLFSQGIKDLWYDLDKDCVSILNKLIKLTNAKVVLSTTWRQFYALEHLVTHLKKFGFEGEVVGITQHKFSSWRDQEIKWWREENSPTEDYIILDDDIYELKDAHKNHFVWIKHGWENGGLKSKRAKWELVRVLRKRNIQWDQP